MKVVQEMTFLRNIWSAVKRNPVLIAFLTAVAAQVFQDWQTNNIDWTHFWGYIFTVFVSIIARNFTVPAREHSDTVDNLHSAIDRMRKGERL